MESIRLQGIRSFLDTGDIKLKPLTVALGKNSCGKSTLLRFFPLLKQTLETKVSEPLLWYGRYVDFGDFGKTISTFEKTGIMSFSFSFKLDVFSQNRMLSTVRNLLSNDNSYATISLEAKKFNKLTIKNGDICIIIEFNDNHFTLSINDEIYDETYLKKFNVTKKTGYLLPIISRNSMSYKDYVNDCKSNKLYLNFINEFLSTSNYNLNDTDDLLFFLIDAFQQKLGMQRIGYFNILFENENINELSQDRKNEIKEAFNKYIVNNYEIAKKIAIFESIEEILGCVNEYIKIFSEQVRYIAPLRSIAERYYRVQGLDLDEVDSRGENVAMILNSMKEKNFPIFQKWLIDNFDFDIKIESSDGHVSICILKDNRQFNLADTGFGYSQIIPIILLIWKNIDHKKFEEKNKLEFQKLSERAMKKYIIIEQPELHLHPKMQHNLVNTIIKAIELDSSLRFIIETHSESFMSYIGANVEEGKIDNSKVNVLLFEQDERGITTIDEKSYSKDGYLEKWPIDFFDGEF